MGFQWGWDKRMPSKVGWGGLIVLGIVALPLLLILLVLVFGGLCLFASDIIEFVAALVRNEGVPSSESAATVFVLLAASACFFTSRAIGCWKKFTAKQRVYAIVKAGGSVAVLLALLTYLARYPMFALQCLWPTWASEADWIVVTVALVVLIVVAAFGVGIGIYHGHPRAGRREEE